jgi:hypothetical protein
MLTSPGLARPSLDAPFLDAVVVAGNTSIFAVTMLLEVRKVRPKGARKSLIAAKVFAAAQVC